MAALSFAVLLAISSMVVMARTRSALVQHSVKVADAVSQQLAFDAARGNELGTVDVAGAAGYTWSVSSGGDTSRGVITVEERRDITAEALAATAMDGPEISIEEPATNAFEVSVTRWVSTRNRTVAVTAHTSLGALGSMMSVLSGTLMWVTLVAVAVIAGLCWLLIGRALAPVERIRSQLDDISASTYDLLVSEPASRDELWRLAVSVNQTLGRLAEARRHQRQFVADASHELRTPIAVIRTLVEVASRSGDWEEITPKLVAETDRLELLVDDLLELARLSGSAPPQRHSCDIAAIVTAEAERLEEAVAPVGGRPLAVDTTRVHPTQAEVIPGQIVRAVRNLTVNAARHARLQVAVACKVSDARLVIEVSDDGSGVPAADRERVFERFTRLDEGRSRDAGGSGLGLALVAQVAAAHGGVASVHTDPVLGGALFRIDIPAHSTDEPPLSATTPGVARSGARRTTRTSRRTNRT